MAVNHLQEQPSGTPWVNDRVRTWEPAPFDPVEYERWASGQFPRRIRIGVPPARRERRPIDPLLSIPKPTPASRIAEGRNPT